MFRVLLEQAHGAPVYILCLSYKKKHLRRVPVVACSTLIILDQICKRIPNRLTGSEHVKCNVPDFNSHYNAAFSYNSQQSVLKIVAIRVSTLVNYILNMVN